MANPIAVIASRRVAALLAMTSFMHGASEVPAGTHANSCGRQNPPWIAGSSAAMMK
jgi:hypothetical protein